MARQPRGRILRALQWLTAPKHSGDLTGHSDGLGTEIVREALSRRRGRKRPRR